MNCLTCKHCYNKTICVLFEELIDELCSCFMYSKR